MAMTSVQLPAGYELSPELLAQLKEDLATQPVRKLTKDERLIYSKAASKAVLYIPAFRDAIAIMRPFMDATASTAYTDAHARVGFGYWFFHLINDSQRASVLLHECMHVLNNHFVRAANIKSLKGKPELFNWAGDFEINTVLGRVEFVDLRDGLLPDRKPFFFPPMKTMEIYSELLLAEQKKKEEQCAVHGKEAKEKRRQEHAEEQKKEEQRQQAKENQDDSGEQDEAGDSENGDQPGEPSDQGQGDQPGGDQPGGEDGHGHGDSGPKCTCGKDGEGDEGEGDGQGQGQGQGAGNGQGQGASGAGKGKGKGWGCDESDESREKAADDAGISRASDVEQTIAKANTAARIVEEKNKGGRSSSGHMDDFWDSILQHLMPKKVDWRKLLRSALAKSSAAVVRGNQNYTYRRPDRRRAGSEFVFPGMVNYIPKITLAIDTSGSMGNEDYQRALNEIEGIVKESAKGKDALSIFSVDTQVGDITPVTSVKKIRLTGGGGTVMAVAWRFVKELPKKQVPDIFVLSTDGYIDWADVEAEVRSSDFRSIILVTQRGGFESAPLSLRQLIPVICIDEDTK